MTKKDLELEVHESMCVGCPSEKRCHDACDRCEDFMEVLFKKEMEDLEETKNVSKED